MSNRERVSEDARRDNARAVADRVKWRKQYIMLTGLIRDLKQKVANSPDAARPKFELAVMQSFASYMMDERESIAQDLRNTAYEWVE